MYILEHMEISFTIRHIKIKTNLYVDLTKLLGDVHR